MAKRTAAKYAAEHAELAANYAAKYTELAANYAESASRNDNESSTEETRKTDSHSSSPILQLTLSKPKQQQRQGSLFFQTIQTSKSDLQRNQQQEGASSSSLKK